MDVISSCAVRLVSSNVWEILFVLLLFLYLLVFESDQTEIGLAHTTEALHKFWPLCEIKHRRK